MNRRTRTKYNRYPKFIVAFASPTSRLSNLKGTLRIFFVNGVPELGFYTASGESRPTRPIATSSIERKLLNGRSCIGSGSFGPALTGRETPIFSVSVSTVNRLRKNRSLLLPDVMFRQPTAGIFVTPTTAHYRHPPTGFPEIQASARRSCALATVK
jgi:hypothetical protein